MLSCTGTWFTKAKSFRQSRETESLSAPVSDWNDLRTGSHIGSRSLQSFENMIILPFPEQEKKSIKSVESFSSTVTTGRGGTWFEGRDVGSASFGLLVWGTAFIATHQKTALFCQSVLFLCVYTARVTLGFTLPFDILHLPEVSLSLSLWHTQERHSMVQYMYVVLRHVRYVSVDSHILYITKGWRA